MVNIPVVVSETVVEVAADADADADADASSVCVLASVCGMLSGVIVVRALVVTESIAEVVPTV